ncbi:hypothetical protein FQZ97_1114200 [compost metagenome]
MLAVEGIEQAPHLRAVAQVPVGEPVFAGDPLQFATDLEELRRRGDPGQPAVLSQHSGFVGQLGVIEHHERVRVQRQ